MSSLIHHLTGNHSEHIAGKLSRKSWPVTTAFAIACICGLCLWLLASCGPATGPSSTPPPSPSRIPASTYTARPPTKVATAKPTATRVIRLTTAGPTATRVTPNTKFVPGDPTATPPGEDITDPNYVQGKLAYKAKDYQQVLRLMEQVVKASPSLAPPHWYRAMAYYYTDNYQAGLSEIEQALALDPNYALAYADRGLLHAATGDIDSALLDWNRALSLDPSLAKVHHNLAVMYYNRGDYAQALVEYDTTVAIDPTRAASWNARSETLLKLELYQECAESAGKAIELAPDLWEGYYSRGVCRGNLAQYDEAMSDLETYYSATITVDDPQGWFKRGLAHNDLGKKPEALIDYTNAIQLNPKFSWALINRGMIYNDLQEYSRAIADFDATLALGEIPMAYLGRGDAYMGMEQYDKAIADYQQAITLTPSFSAAYAHLAGAYLANEEYQKAIEAANQELLLAPGSDDELKTLQVRGRAHYGLGDYAQAIEDLSKVISSHPSVMDYYYRGIAYQANGQKQDAISDLVYFLQMSRQGIAQDKIDDAQARLNDLRK